MASERGLTSNLIIKASAPKPKIEKLGDITNRLQSILELQQKINAQKTRVHVDLTGSTKAISSLREIIKLSGKAFREVPRDKRVIPPSKTPPPFRPTSPPPVSGTSLSETRSRKQTAKGIKESVQTQDVTFKGAEERLRTITQTDDSIEDKIKKTNLQVEGDRRRQRKAANLRADQEMKFAEAEKEFGLNQARNRKDIERALRQGFTVAGSAQVSINPVKGLDKALTGAVTRLERRVSSGNKSGAVQIIDISDAQTSTGPRKIRTNKDTIEYRANREAEARAKRSLAAQRRESESGNRAVALFNRTNSEFQNLEKNLKSMGYQVRDVGSGVREIAPGISRMVTQAEFFRTMANGREEVISARSDRAGYKNLPSRGTQQSKDLLASQEFLRTVQAAATLDKRLTALGYSVQTVGNEFKEVGGQVVNVATREYRRKVAGGIGEDEVFRVAEDRAKARRRIDRNTPEYKESIRNQNISRHSAAQQSLAATPGTELRQARGDILLYATAQQDGTEVMTRFNRITGEQQTYLNKNTKAANEYRRATQILSNEIAYQNREVQLMNQGYTRAAQKISTFEVAGQQVTSRMTELRRVTGNALFGNLQLEIEKMDSSTGKMTRQVLTGRDAMRQMGDSFSNATAKVALWLGATQGLFTAIQLIQRAWEETKQLESGTILLARVSRGLGSSFKEQLEGARQLTAEIINLSTQTGVSAIEAQQAATIFGRAGQNRLQIIESVRVALLASKIAELGVVDAANLLASAQAQFGIKAENSIDILNTLNSLSNNYRVTTNDLFQSISRAGSVYAEHNGTLEQLAATTALVSAATNRSGAEIGNALKTIQSRLTAPEVAGTLLQTAGISTRTLAGETKNLTKILLQLRIVEQQLGEQEAQQLNVRITGARQVNILQSALNNVTQAVIAEANALRDTTSAGDEASQQNKSLQSGLDRMSQLFTKLVSSGTSFNVMITSLVNVINQVLRLIGAFDGLAIKIGLGVAAFTLIRLAVVRFNLQSITLAGTMTFLRTTIIAATNAATSGAAGMASFGAILSKTNLIALALTAVIALLTFALSSNEQATADAATREKEHGDQLQRTTSLAEKKAKAAKEVRDALEEWLQALEDLDKQEAEGKAVDPKTREFYAKQVELITGKTAKFNKDGSGINPLKNGKLDPAEVANIRKRAEEIQKEENKQTQASLREQIKNEKTIRVARRSEIEKLDKDEAERKVATFGKSVTLGRFSKNGREDDVFIKNISDLTDDQLLQEKALKEKSLKEDVKDINSEAAQIRLDQYRSGLNKINQEIQKRADYLDAVRLKNNDITESDERQLELEQQIQKAQKGLKAGATITEENLKEAVNQAQQVEARMDQFKKLDDANYKVSTGNPGEEQILIQEKLIHLTETLAIARKSLERLSQSEEHSDAFQKEAENARKAVDEVRKYQQILKELRIEQARSFVEDRIKNSKGILEEFAISRTKLRQLNAGVDPGIVDADEINRIKIKKEQAAAFLKQGELAGGDPRLTAEERIGVVTASNKAAVDSLTEAKDLEIDQAKKLLSLEFEILKQKKEQNKEALKALGLLSDEDKLRVLAIAKDLRKRGGNISAEEQFFNSEGTNRLLQQFFGNNLDPMSVQEGRLGNAFRGIDLGAADPDLKKKQDQLNQALKDNNAADPKEAAGNALDRIEMLQKQIDKLNGKDQVNKNGVLGNGVQQGVKDQIKNFNANPFENMNVNLDMMPLVEAFRNVTVTQVKTLRDEMVAELGKIGDEILRIKGVRGVLPRVDVGN